MEPLLVSFLYLCLHVAVIVFVALAIVWLLKICGVGLDPQLYKVGKIIVVILIIIAVVLWILGVSPTFGRLF